MVYYCKVLENKKKNYHESYFWMSADNEKALEKRVRTQYGLLENEYEILKKKKDEDIKI